MLESMGTVAEGGSFFEFWALELEFPDFNFALHFAANPFTFVAAALDLVVNVDPNLVVFVVFVVVVDDVVAIGGSVGVMYVVEGVENVVVWTSVTGSVWEGEEEWGEEFGNSEIASVREGERGVAFGNSEIGAG